jgi:hypothetical protein
LTRTYLHFISHVFGPKIPKNSLIQWDPRRHP